MPRGRRGRLWLLGLAVPRSTLELELRPVLLSLFIEFDNEVNLFVEYINHSTMILFYSKSVNSTLNSQGDAVDDYHVNFFKTKTNT